MMQPINRLQPISSTTPNGLGSGPGAAYIGTARRNLPQRKPSRHSAAESGKAGPRHASKEAWLVRLATLATPNGPRLHVRARSGYVDIAQATADPRFASFGSFVAIGPAALDAARGL